jgi:hypothetical protein
MMVMRDPVIFAMTCIDVDISLQFYLLITLAISSMVFRYSQIHSIIYSAINTQANWIY